jgi:hypothetical protein
MEEAPTRAYAPWHGSSVRSGCRGMCHLNRWLPRLNVHCYNLNVDFVAARAQTMCQDFKLLQESPALPLSRGLPMSWGAQLEWPAGHAHTGPRARCRGWTRSGRRSWAGRGSRRRGRGEPRCLGWVRLSRPRSAVRVPTSADPTLHTSVEGHGPANHRPSRSKLNA